MGLDKRSASKVSSAFRMLCNKNCGWAWKQGYTISAHHATIIRPLSQAVTWVLHSPEPKAWPKKIWKISLIGCGTKLMGSAWQFFWSFITHVTYCWCTFPSEHSPKDTPFEDGTFKLTMQFTEEYPNKPPTVRVVSRMFHPNGETCWLPVIRVFYSAPVSTIFLPHSVCRWKYMSRYITESLESYIWCLFYINFYTGEANSKYCFFLVVSLPCGPTNWW